MPFSQAQIDAAASAVLNANAKKKPIDQVNKERPFLEWLIANKKNTVGGLQFYTEPVRIGNDSNYQNYFGADQVSYNKKDTTRRTQWPWYDAHDGFTIDEDEASQFGIILTDDREAVASDAEQVMLFNLLEEKYETLRLGYQEQMDLEFHRDGTQNAKAAPGLDLLVSTTPTAGTVGGINAATSVYWRNYANMGISTATAGTLVAAMETAWRACITVGGRAPTKIFAGAAFIDAYAKDVRTQGNTQVVVTAPARGGVALDGSRSGVWFKNVEIEWDPTFETLDALLGAITYPWTKRCYFLNPDSIVLRPLSGRWMQNRSPSRIYDRYVHYRAITSAYRLTTGQRNSAAVISIA